MTVIYSFKNIRIHYGEYYSGVCYNAVRPQMKCDSTRKTALWRQPCDVRIRLHVIIASLWWTTLRMKKRTPASRSCENSIFDLMRCVVPVEFPRFTVYIFTSVNENNLKACIDECTAWKDLISMLIKAQF